MMYSISCYIGQHSNSTWLCFYPPNHQWVSMRYIYHKRNKQKYIFIKFELQMKNHQWHITGIILGMGCAKESWHYIVCQRSLAEPIPRMIPASAWNCHDKLGEWVMRAFCCSNTETVVIELTLCVHQMFSWEIYEFSPVLSNGICHEIVQQVFINSLL